MRDQALSKIVATLQAQIRGYIMRKDYQENVRTTFSIISFTT